MKVKKEVKDLCVDLINAHKKGNKDEFKRIEGILENKYKFTPYSLLALFYNPPIIEYNDNNFSLVMEDKE